MELIPNLKEELGTKQEFEMRDQILSKEMGTNEANMIDEESEKLSRYHLDNCAGCALCEL